MALFRRLFGILLVLLIATPLFAQSAGPSVEIVLSTDQAQKGDTVYADVVIHDGYAVAGADVGIITDDCLRVVERQPGNFLPSTAEEGGFSPFSELTDHTTRFSASIIDRARIVSGDGTFYRVKMEVTCDVATPEVKVTFAQLAALAKPDTESNDLVGYTLEHGNLAVTSDAIKVAQGAVVSTPVPVQALPPLASVAVPATNQNSILFVALAVMGLALVGLIALLIVYQRRQRYRDQSSA